MNRQIPADAVLDVTGLCCPMPVLRSRQAIDRLEPGQILEVRATDPGSRRDIPAWASQLGHEVVQVQEDGGVVHFFIRKRR